MTKSAKGDMTEREKIHAIYNLIGDRGLYVNTNYDVFVSPDSDEPSYEEISLGTSNFRVSLANPNSKSYNSTLLFETLTALMKHGTMLITGAPGIGKTTGAEYVGHFFTGIPLRDILASEIKGHPQQTEEKMVASYDLPELMAHKKIIVPTKFLESPIKILDEGNRNPEDVLSILMELADRGFAIYGGEGRI